MMDPIDLHAFADGELSGPEAKNLRAQAQQDPQLKAELDAILNLKDFLKEKSLTHTSEETWRACVVRFDAIDRSRRVETFVGRYAWAMCAVVFCAILTGRFAVHGVRGDTARTADLLPIFARHNRTTTPASPVVNQWIDNVFDQARDANDPKRVYIVQHVMGLCELGRVDRVDLRDGNGQMTLLVVPGELRFEDTVPLPGNPPVFGGELNGQNCIAWTDAGHSFLLQGIRPIEDLQEIAARIRK